LLRGACGVASIAIDDSRCRRTVREESHIEVNQQGEDLDE
jgi:hypothetical protein